MQKVIKFLSDSYNGATITVSGALTGTAADQVNILGIDIEHFFQYGVWSLTILVAILTIIGWCQKQIDRHKNKKDNKLPKR